MSYKHEVFLSYPNMGSDWNRFIEEVFLRTLQGHLVPAVGTRNEKQLIFFDKRDIHTGEVWQDKLAIAHAQSKLIVALICNRYFQSPWCAIELGLMDWRRKQSSVNSGAISLPPLILPIRINKDESNFSRNITDIQAYDISGIDCISMRYGSGTHTRFSKELKNWVDNTLITAIKSVPQCCDDWRTYNLQKHNQDQCVNDFSTLPEEQVKVPFIRLQS